MDEEYINCKACDRKFPISNLELHLLSKKHKDNEAKKENEMEQQNEMEKENEIKQENEIKMDKENVMDEEYAKQEEFLRNNNITNIEQYLDGRMQNHGSYCQDIDF